jgi:hypothetical protein
MIPFGLFICWLVAIVGCASRPNDTNDKRGNREAPLIRPSGFSDGQKYVLEK